MKSIKKGNQIFGRLEKGEEIITAFRELCSIHQIKSGFISGLGAAEDVQVAFYNAAEKKYISKIFHGDYELVSLNGSISTVNNEPHVHLHIVIGDDSYKLYGGHLESGIVSLTCEFMIQTFDAQISRKFDEETGLNLLDF